MTLRPARPGESLVGVVANPLSGHDIRRLVSRASVFPNTEKVAMLQRVLTALGAVGVDRVVSMADAAGLMAGLLHAVEGHRVERDPPWPLVEVLDQPISGTGADSAAAAADLVGLGAGVILVLGGDGTNRLVAAGAGGVPLATLSTGTNNAFARIGEATVVGLACGLVATGRVARSEGCTRNKVLLFDHAGRREPALVDVAVTSASGVGARAVWDPAVLRELFVAFAEPDAVGLSSIAGLVEPVSRAEPRGLRLRLDPAARRHVLAPLAPGLVRRVGIRSTEPLVPDVPVRVDDGPGVVALDGEREIELRGPARVTLSLTGPWTLDVPTVMGLASRRGLLAGGH